MIIGIRFLCDQLSDKEYQYKVSPPKYSGEEE